MLVERENCAFFDGGEYAARFDSRLLSHIRGSYLVLVLLHHGELSLQLPQHLELRRLQAGPVTPQLFQHLEMR